MAAVLGTVTSVTTLVVQLNDALQLFAQVKGAPKKVRELISSLENLNGVMSTIKADPAYQQEEVAKRPQPAHGSYKPLNTSNGKIRALSPDSFGYAGELDKGRPHCQSLPLNISG
ncbi:uncharacterized protein Z519_05099 [Cladophialophora bantiana CBS 173.52]|uniref:Uncharacterized protein n=1 Tax=Cladophialophora bantiana (strain ATCC 10958 / CBS 173.52 / CDC B-1940 / NIH 8579) TaxID=1442370 RepID=A0A0D2IAF7_CLAB1|nr:uncharacterized protein Z519_05099 [Cladophialophora bantiana CBS 173.52]KIW93784.1 hypothetical protein Z519_05099 [Cladophialophora bantiana CBS 173.52]